MEASMRKVMRNTAVISLGLLGVFYNIESNGAPLPFKSCDVLPGGNLIGLVSPNPAAVTGVQSGFSILNVYVRGQDNHIYENALKHDGFPGWSEVPGGGVTLSAPSAVVSGGVVKLFVRGVGSGIWENDFDGAMWSGWSPVGGKYTLSSPAAVVHQGTTKLFIRGTDDRIYENDLNGGGWFEVFGGAFTISSPAAITYHNSLYLFHRGQNNRVYMSVNGANWIEVPGGGLTLAGPSALIDSNGTILKLFVTGTDDGIYENDFDGGNWSGWSVISATVPASAIRPSVTPSAPSALEAFSIAPEVFFTTEDGQIMECFF
jgi:hypothetical protein